MSRRRLLDTARSLLQTRREGFDLALDSPAPAASLLARRLHLRASATALVGGLVQRSDWHQPCQARGAKKKAKFAEAAGDGAVQEDIDLEATQKSMAASLERLQSILATVRTGRASTGLLENLSIEMYGDRVPLRSLAAISIRDAQTLLVSPWDKETVAGITKAIGDSPLHLSPREEGAEVIVPVPKPSKELVAGMQRMVKQEAESSRVSVRQARRDAVDRAKAVVSKNDKALAERKVQTLTDRYTTQISEAVEAKEAELAHIL